MSTDIAISILIVNWNSKELLRECLLSIQRTCADLALQIVVVDGASFDGCAAMLADEFPDAEFLQSMENIGFGCANNLGLELVRGQAVLVLNPDTELQPAALQTLLKELRSRPDAGIVSPRLLNADRTLQSSVHALPRPIRQALDSEVLRRILSPSALWAPPRNFSPLHTVEVEAVPGTCMLMWTKTFREVGAFTPAYFMYAEDMDLCLKIRRAGHRIYHVPSAEVIHHGGASSASQGSTFSAVMIREALNAYMLLNHGPRHALAYRIATGGSALIRLMLLAPGVLFTDRQRRQRQKALIQRWWTVLSWSCGRERWARRHFSLPAAG